MKNAAVEDLETYPWPDPDDPGRHEGLRDEARRLKEETNFAIIVDEPLLGLFESGWVTLCGPERFFVDMLADKPYIHAFFEKLCELQKRLYKNYLAEIEAYIDVIMVSGEASIPGTFSPSVPRKTSSAMFDSGSPTRHQTAGTFSPPSTTSRKG